MKLSTSWYPEIPNCELGIAAIQNTKRSEWDEIDSLLINSRITYGEAKVSCNDPAECQ